MNTCGKNTPEEAHRFVDTKQILSQSFIELLCLIATRSKCYFYRFFGGEDDSLNKLLQISCEQMKSMLIKLDLLSKDEKFNKNNVYNLVEQIGLNSEIVPYTNYFPDDPRKKREKLLLLKLGTPTSSCPKRPKEQYKRGHLVQGFSRYILRDREKELRMQILSLISSSDKAFVGQNQDDPTSTAPPDQMSTYVQDIASIFLKDGTEQNKISQRQDRAIRRVLQSFCCNLIIATQSLHLKGDRRENLEFSEEQDESVVPDEQGEIEKNEKSKASETTLLNLITDSFSQKDRVFPVIGGNDRILKIVIPYHSRFEVILRDMGIFRELYHGGDFNGVDCVRIMKMAHAIIEKQTALILEMAGSTNQDTANAIALRQQQYDDLLGVFDLIWSSVRGVQGLLPTDHDLYSLNRALNAAKKQWIAMGMSTQQPKWHMVFDGHLLEHVKRFGGLSDKDEGVIEKAHQDFGRMRDRYKSVTNFELKHRLIHEKWRIGRHPRNIALIASFQLKRSQCNDSNRKKKAEERWNDITEKKKVKREGYLAKLEEEIDRYEQDREDQEEQLDRADEEHAVMMMSI